MTKCKPLAWVGVLMLAAVSAAPVRAESVFSQKPEDAGAVVVTAEAFGVKGDGVADDTEGLQKAVNQGRGGIVLLPEGRYRVTKTVIVPTGTRVIGFGKNRPVIVLGANTPGFQEKGKGYPFGLGKYMIHFAQSVRADGAIVDASELDFNSAMNNVDFEVGEGNPSAVCVRFHVAQHSYLNNMEFKLGSALAAMEDIGNQSANVHISGGQYGIISTRTQPELAVFADGFDVRGAERGGGADAGCGVIAGAVQFCTYAGGGGDSGGGDGSDLWEGSAAGGYQDDGGEGGGFSEFQT